MLYLKKIGLVTLLLLITGVCMAQDSLPGSHGYKIISAGAEYKKSAFYQWFWGRNRRKEWTTPVRVPVVNLDSLYGGLHPYQRGGGNETKSLRLKNNDGKEFTLRSINKSRNDVVADEFKGTFVEDIIQDEVSMSYPYAAFAVPVMQQYAGIPHTNPLLVYVPPQPALDTFSKKFGNDLYLLEQRPDGDWSDADNLGRFKKFSSTGKVVEKLLENSAASADQHAFIKVRLFDMLISDWDRHEDNWRWGVADYKGNPVYTPVPRDRDQAFYTRNGVLITRIMDVQKLDFMQDFSYRVKDINLLNMEQRNMDRFFTNRMNLDDWINAARELQQSLTDTVIIQSVKEMPAEIYNISGTELVDKLKSRRSQLEAFAKEYYLFLAKEVDITGSQKRDYFEVKRLGSGETIVNVFSVNKRAVKSETPFYTRVFNPLETKEIRLYGIDGEDTYNVYDKSPDIKLRIIGGPENDSVFEDKNKRVHIYDDHNNRFKTTSAKFHFSNDSAIHVYKYDGYNYNLKTVIPYLFFNGTDGWFVGLNYNFRRYRWRREPYANTHTIGLNYYGAKRAITASASVLYPNLIGKWDLKLSGAYDALKWTNFFGTGNKTLSSSDDRTYYRVRSIEWNAAAGIGRKIGNSSILFSALFQRTKIMNDTSRYIAKILQDPKEFRPNYYAGIQLGYTYLKVNDSIVPTSGFTFLAKAGCFLNTTQSDFFQNYIAKLQVYVPLSYKFSFAIRTGMETIVGNSSVVNNAQFYQHAVIGGPVNIRGFRAERFWGKTAFYNQNELRYITTIKTHLMNARAGLVAFFDDGRVWIPGEKSTILHTSYGGGILITPFYRISASVTYGVSNESNLLQVGINTLF